MIPEKTPDKTPLNEKITTLLKIEKIPQGILREKDVRFHVQRILERILKHNNRTYISKYVVEEIVKSEMGRRLAE